MALVIQCLQTQHCRCVVVNRALGLSLRGTKRQNNHERLLSQEIATHLVGARNDVRYQNFVHGRLTVNRIGSVPEIAISTIA
jgi:hypothetical protein